MRSYSRFLRGETAYYTAYSCAAGAFLPVKPFAAAPLTILEGSYSLHPALQTEFAVRVFVTCPPDVQEARLQARGNTLRKFYAAVDPVRGGVFLLPMIQPRAAILYWTRRRFLCNIVNGPMA